MSKPFSDSASRPQNRESIAPLMVLGHCPTGSGNPEPQRVVLTALDHRDKRGDDAFKLLKAIP